MEHKVGEVFEYKDKKVQVVLIEPGDNKTCEDCIFKNLVDCFNTECCLSNFREDNNNVYFIEVKDK